MYITLFLCVAIINLSTAFSDSDDIYKSKNSEDYVPCENGWYYFRNKCYRVVGRPLPERFTWTRALELCRRYGADLVSIQSKEEQNFITAYLQLDFGWWSWIGLNDRDKEGEYKWTDGSVFNYTNWNVNEPSGTDGDKEDCVHTIFEPGNDIVGKWIDRSCDDKEHALCEINASPRKRYPNPIYCSREEGGGWKHGSSCYHIVTELKSWQNAERHCKTYYNGHLLTLRYTLHDIFVEIALPDIEKEIWIGIKIQNQLQQKWTSGWYVSYDRFNKDESYEEGTCVARRNRREWITIPCAEQLPFICEVTKATPPALVPPPVGSHCPKQLDDWRDFGGDYCYYIETTKMSTFYEASFDCQRRGGHLVSLHSKEEADILLPFVKYKGYSIYIGLIRLKVNNEEAFGWIDGSVFDYENWSYGEPNGLDEKCVEALTDNMEWRDTRCDHKLFGYICSVKKVISSFSLEKADDCENFCIPLATHLHGILSQSPEVKRIPCKKT